MTGFGQSRERAERLLMLSSVLRQGRPLTLAELREQYGLYAKGAEESARRAFERDKADLRDLGVEIATVTTEDTPAYWIRSTGATVTFRWRDDELDALAVLTAAISDDETGVALAKLSASSGQFAADEASARIQTDLAVPPEVVRAIAEERQLTLRYRNAEGVESERTIEPWELQARRGLLYVAAFDLASVEERRFRVDRIAGGLQLGGPAERPRPAGVLAPPYPDERWDFELAVPAGLRHDVVVMGGRVVDESGGWLDVRFDDMRSEPVLGWALRHGAVVRSPTVFAVEQRQRLETLVERHTRPPPSVQPPPTRKARRATLSDVRLERLLALPKWLGERPGVTRAEVAAAFGATVEEIDAELDLLGDIDVPGLGALGRVEEVDGQLEFLRYVEEPVVELTPTEALRLLLLVEAGAAVLAEHDVPALRSIAERLRSAVPASVQLDLAGLDHPDLTLVKQAITERQLVRFQYRGRKDAEWRDRQVLPAQLRVAHGAVYLAGTDVVSGEDRNFRLDRLSDVELTGEFPALAAEADRPAYVATAPEVEAVLLLSTKATWLVTLVAPVASGPSDGGGAVAVVRTDAVDWLVSHVMSAGGEAEVVAPAELRTRIAETAAGALGNLSR